MIPDGLVGNPTPPPFLVAVAGAAEERAHAELLPQERQQRQHEAETEHVHQHEEEHRDERAHRPHSAAEGRGRVGLGAGVCAEEGGRRFGPAGWVGWCSSTLEGSRGKTRRVAFARLIGGSLSQPDGWVCSECARALKNGEPPCSSGTWKEKLQCWFDILQEGGLEKKKSKN